jgi:hypothetical protein
MGEALEHLVELTTIHVRAHKRHNPITGLLDDVKEYWRDSAFNIGDLVESLDRPGGQTRGTVIAVMQPDDRPDNRARSTQRDRRTPFGLESSSEVAASEFRAEPMYRVRWSTRYTTLETESRLAPVDRRKYGIPPRQHGIRIGWSREDLPDG